MGRLDRQLAWAFQKRDLLEGSLELHKSFEGIAEADFVAALVFPPTSEKSQLRQASLEMEQGTQSYHYDQLAAILPPNVPGKDWELAHFQRSQIC